MTSTFAAAGLAAILLSLTCGSALAGPIERACLQSNRNAANRVICSCIQQVADQTLGGSDQRRAAKFFGNPEKANAVWQSKSRADDAFWDRYKIFGSQAEASCSAG